MDRFQLECMETDCNFSMSSAIICNEDYTGLEVHGNYRTRGDLGALVWWTEDYRMHKSARYPNDSDYSGTVLSFEFNHDPDTISYTDTELAPPMTIIFEDDSEAYITLGFCRPSSESSTGFSHANGTSLGTWIEWDSESYEWEADVVVGYEDIFDENGMYVETVEIIEHQTGSGSRDGDYVIDYKLGKVLPVGGSSVPFNADVRMTYRSHYGSTYTIDFNTLYQGEHPNYSDYIAPIKIKKIFFPILPTGYQKNDYTNTGESTPFKVCFNNWIVEGGDIGSPDKSLQAHNLNIAEGYDDEYYRNPKRLVDTLKHLGYAGIFNLYIGASHYYDKVGNLGENGLDHKTHYLVTGYPLNKAFEAWYGSLCKELVLAGFKKIVVSISMEILQMPETWKQRMADGMPGQTGWEPPTSFISPCSPEARPFMNYLAGILLTKAASSGIPPILQLGEPWWWFQEFEPGNVQIPYEGRPPCFYDDSTKAKFRKDMGYEMPIWSTSEVEMTPQNIKVCEWLRDQLGNYSNFFREIAKSYGVPYTILFFPPSVMDRQRVPKCMQIANVPQSAWQYPMLDLIQIEDYDWLIHDNPNHRDVFNFASSYYGYPDEKTHYFAGFAWSEYNLPIDVQWKRIKKSALLALGMGQKVFIWAGTQVRRDSWVFEGFNYGSMAVPMVDVKKSHLAIKE